ncbi:hypothetical protein BLOT_008964 [Blomia tropicalis]|nr:hypothetical protein BLOT_008964 [Blomia tropicalis]
MKENDIRLRLLKTCDQPAVFAKQITEGFTSGLRRTRSVCARPLQPFIYYCCQFIQLVYGPIGLLGVDRTGELNGDGKMPAMPSSILVACDIVRRVGSKCLVKPWIVKLFFGLALRLPGLFNDVFDDTKSEEDGDDNEHGDEATGEFKLVDRIRSPSPTRLPIPIISGRFRTFPSSDSSGSGQHTSFGCGREPECFAILNQDTASNQNRIRLYRQNIRQYPTMLLDMT